jgi:chemotaxis protein MotB
VDKRKVGRLAMAIQVAFQELGVFETSNTKVPLSDSESMPFEKVQIVENVSRTNDLNRLVNPMSGALSNALPPDLRDIRGELEKALAPEIRNRIVSLKSRRDGLVVSLQEIGFFDSGSAALRPSSESTVRRLDDILKPRTEMIRIEGHTDNIPIHNSHFDSNWELSTARATELIKKFIVEYNFPPARLTAAGYAEFHPIASNATEEGRMRNRRVDVVILAPPAASSAQTSNEHQGNTASPPSKSTVQQSANQPSEN